MPMSYTTYTVSAVVSTIYNYSTSYDEYLQATTVPAYGAGTRGITQTTIVDNGITTTKDVYKTGDIVITYTSSVPYAVGETGTPVSTVSNPARVTSYEVTSWYPYSVPEPACGPSSWTVCSWSKDCSKCTISGGTVQLLYFPTTATRPGLQNSSSTSMPPQITSAPSTNIGTATYENTTLTSPSIYISFYTAYAQDDCGNQVGKRYPGAILPMKPGELSSVYGGYGTMWSSDPNIPNFSTPYLIAGSFNLADLNWPYPITAYKNQLKYALGREVFSIVTSPYNPVLAVPPEIRNLDPAWVSCALDWEGLYDPPIALTQTNVIAGPTTPNLPVQPTTSPPPEVNPPVALKPTTAVVSPTMPEAPNALSPTTAIQVPTGPYYAGPSPVASPDPELGTDPGRQQPNTPPNPGHDSAETNVPNADPGTAAGDSPAVEPPNLAGPGLSSPAGNEAASQELGQESPGTISPSPDPGRGSGTNPSAGPQSQVGPGSTDSGGNGAGGGATLPSSAPSSPGQLEQHSTAQQGENPVRASISAVTNGLVVADVHGTTTIVLHGPSAQATIALGSTTITASRVSAASGAVDVVDGTTISAGGSAIVVGDDSTTSSRGASGNPPVSGNTATSTPGVVTGDAGASRKHKWAVGCALILTALTVTL